MQAGLFSATVTTFLVASYPNLQPDPPTQTETLAEQSVFLLSLITAHLGANSSLLPPASPTHLEGFTPAASDVRINTCWSVSLVLSLTAALFATIVQQWARDYMNLYQRYSSNLKRARIRQYLFEGADKYKMSFMVDVIPTLIHGSLFLFFWGLCDMLWQINFIVAIMTSLSIALAAAFYAYTVVSPVLNAQSPYQSPLSGIFWYFFRVIRRRTYSDTSTGGINRPISSNMSDGRVQLAMNNAVERRQRDARAIGWVIDNLTEDTELEPFLSGIPGSLGTKWGKEVWGDVAKNTDRPRKSDATMALSYAQPDESPFSLSSSDTVIDLSGRITRLLRTCIDPGILDPHSRRQRARACVEAALSLVLNMNKGKWQWFADKEIMAVTLHYLADPANHSPDRGQNVFPLADSAFRNRWLCMSIMTTHALLRDDRVRDCARVAIQKLSEACGDSQTLSVDAAAQKSSAMLDKLVKKAWHAGWALRDKLNTSEVPEDLLAEILSSKEHNANIAELEYCWNILGWAKPVDDAMRSVVQAVSDVTGRILTLLPGASISTSDSSTCSSDTYGLQNTMMPHFLLPVKMASRLVDTACRLRDIQRTTWDAYSTKPSKLIELSPDELYVDDMRRRMSAVAAGLEGSVRPFREQLWRLQDLAVKHGATLYVLDLFFNALRSTSVKHTPDSEELYVGTFRAITTNWMKHCDSAAFQAGLVALMRDVLWRESVGTAPPLPRLPPYIINEVLQLVLNVFTTAKEPRSSIIDEAATVVEKFSSISEIPIPTRSLVQKFLGRIKPPRILDYPDRNP